MLFDKLVLIWSSFPLNVFDYRQAWIALEGMSKDDAMIRFVDLLDALCPLFKPYIEAHKRDREMRDLKE